MAAPKKPQRAEFLRRLDEIRDDLPRYYTGMLLVKLRKPRVLARVENPKVREKLADDRTAGVYFNQVVKAQSVDFVVLDALEEIVDELRASRQPVTA